MTAERWARVQHLFERAAALPVAEREAVVQTADDEEMAALVRSMLAADAADGGEIEAAVGRALDEVSHGAVAAADRRLGPYRILSELGQGGMGTVYLAERADGAFAQRVAIKVVRGLLDADRVRRFRAERQMLASLQHPNIARLIDGGTTDDGWPYLVMEFVDGAPIDAFADSHRLDLAARLALFRTVCEAVGHAHRHLIVHRDIKPSNILVTTDGTPKLLDFGIAKLLDDTDPELSARTMTDMRLLTPDYAAPEQVRGEPVTTATDVYALGVLLFELLTGQRPHAFRSLTAQEIERVVCETDAPRPSTVARGLPDDLDVIVGTALHKDRARRYTSVEALADDLGRFLDGLPIQARPATWRYRARRFAARHRWGVGIAAAFVLLLVGFSVIVSVQAARLARERDVAQRERDTAEEVSSFLVGLFEVSDPRQARGDTITARELLERGASRVESSLADQPVVQGRLMDTIGRVYRQLGLYDQAEALLVKALARREAAAAIPDDGVADTVSELAEVAREKGDYQRAETLHRRALDLRRGLHGDRHDSVASSTNSLGLALEQQGRYEEAEALLRTAIARWRELRPAGDPQVAVALNNLGLLLRRVGRYQDAEPVLKEALDIRRQAFGSRHPLLANSLMQYGQLLDELGRWDEAERHMRESLEMRLQVLGADHPLVGSAYNNLASLAHDRRQYEAAEALYRASLDLSRKSWGDDHPETAVTLNNLASLMEDRGDPAAAEPLFRQALAIRQAALGPGHPAVARGQHNLARTLMARGQLAEADALLATALSTRQRVLGPAHVEIAGSLALQAQLRARQDRLAEALPLAEAAVAMLRQVLPADHPTLATTLIAHSALLRRAGRGDEARSAAEDALRIRRARLPAGDPAIGEAEKALDEATAGQ